MTALKEDLEPIFETRPTVVCCWIESRWLDSKKLTREYMQQAIRQAYCVAEHPRDNKGEHTCPLCTSMKRMRNPNAAPVRTIEVGSDIEISESGKEVFFTFAVIPRCSSSRNHFQSDMSIAVPLSNSRLLSPFFRIKSRKITKPNKVPMVLGIKPLIFTTKEETSLSIHLFCTTTNRCESSLLCFGMEQKLKCFKPLRTRLKSYSVRLTPFYIALNQPNPDCTVLRLLLQYQSTGVAAQLAALMQTTSIALLLCTCAIIQTPKRSTPAFHDQIGTRERLYLSNLPDEGTQLGGPSKQNCLARNVWDTTWVPLGDACIPLTTVLSKILEPYRPHPVSLKTNNTTRGAGSQPPSRATAPTCNAFNCTHQGGNRH
ncbi:hypothetical protein Pelo_1109 [Pelomyxa schiedti]|nr:hypothetical protein Pelo_1109 [Pelomyxa schiedti]